LVYSCISAVILVYQSQGCVSQTQIMNTIIKLLTQVEPLIREH